jgi:outer membrane protein TolC
MTIVKNNHPIAKQAELKNEFAEAELMRSRGGFDPIAFGDVNQKYFSDEQYYNLIDAGLKVPTWFGIELYTGFEQGEGNYINPERSTPNNGLVYGGISLAVGRGLFIDERRAQLKKAKIYTDFTKEERRILINELMLQASQVYWKWYSAAQKVDIIDQAVTLADIRFNGVKQGALVGESPSIDTLEALIQLQNRQILFQEAVLDYDNAKEALNIYLWDENEVPLEISERIQPPSNDELLSKINVIEQTDFLDSLISNHPQLVKGKLYLDQLEVERRLKAEQLKPQLDLKYNALNEPLNGNIMDGYSINNYRWGLTFSMPLFLRESRGELKRTKLIIQDQKLGMDNLQAKIKYGVNTSINNWKTSQSQIEIYNQTVFNVERLVEGEQQKFEIGESSLFLVNQREMSYIKAQVDFIKMIAKNQHAFIEVQYSLGLLD